MSFEAILASLFVHSLIYFSFFFFFLSWDWAGYVSKGYVWSGWGMVMSLVPRVSSFNSDTEEPQVLNL